MMKGKKRVKEEEKKLKSQPTNQLLELYFISFSLPSSFPLFGCDYHNYPINPVKFCNQRKLWLWLFSLNLAIIIKIEGKQRRRRKRIEALLASFWHTPYIQSEKIRKVYVLAIRNCQVEIFQFLFLLRLKDVKIKHQKQPKQTIKSRQFLFDFCKIPIVQLSFQSFFYVFVIGKNGGQ